MTSDRHRRSLLNPQVDRRARLRLLMPFLILIIAFALIGKSMDQTISAIGEQFTQNLAAQNAEAALQFTALIDKVKLVIAIDVLFMIVLSLLLWAYYSFRIFGPLVAVYRHIRALIDGNYDARLRLRRHDEFVDLSNQLNELAEALKERNKK